VLVNENACAPCASLHAAALQLRGACLVLLDGTHPDPQVREKVYEQVAHEVLVQACTLIGELARPAEDTQHYQERLGKICDCPLVRALRSCGQ